MDGIKELVPNYFGLLVVEKGFEEQLLVKDYYLTIILYLIKDIPGLFFKGGTALQKTLLNYARISEDIDFTLDRPIKEIRKEIEKTINDSQIFGKITPDKDVDGFLRLVVPYQTKFGKGSIFIDLNERAKLLTKPEKHKMKSFYPNIPEFGFPTLSLREMVAEKVAASIGRNKPRDHYDIYRLIKAKIPIDMKLVEKKCKQSNHEFSIIKMFNNAKKLKNRWDQDMIPLLAEEVTFQEVITTMAKYFKLKAEKELVKEK
ncbi:MAG: nucleotidyl transferase AbiEii/AbiGii toxin family protein [archaeon]